MDADAPAGTVTMLFTDIEGSTRLLRALGERYGDLLRDHQALLREVAGSHGGRVVDMQGDAFFFVFPTSKAALLAGVEAQRRLSVHAWPDDARVRVRMGMHTGEPALSGDGYLGIDVVNAARICSAAHGGQLIVSESTRALARSDPPPEIRFRDLGEFTLDGLDEPQRLYQVESAGLLESFPPPRTSGPEPPSVSTIEQRADEWSSRIEALVTSRVESSLERSFRTDAGEEDRPPAGGDDRPPAGELMKLSIVGLVTLLLFVVVIALSVLVVRAVF
ncbi:MAG: adenylate/guanylate cyclase domain-containing protein [Gaiellales bacterium]